jgi:hypothetical protein
MTARRVLLGFVLGILVFRQGLEWYSAAEERLAYRGITSVPEDKADLRQMGRDLRDGVLRPNDLPTRPFKSGQ